MQHLDRRGFLAGSSLIAGSALVPTAVTNAALQAEPDAAEPFTSRQDPQLVRRMVGVSHGNLDAVREFLAQDPELAKASWDWGFGDWESALGAASHTGARDIALLLLEHGARKDLFCAAMLGELEVVQAMVHAQPGIQRVPGPHGLTLLHHARAGRDAAKPVVEYLESLGDADPAGQPVVLEEIDGQKLLGTYHTTDGNAVHIETRDTQGGLWLRYDGEPSRQLFLTNQTDAFYPAGASRVQIRFERNGAGAGQKLHIAWPGGKTINAVRAGG